MHRQKNTVFGNVMLLLCALVWGFAFAAQRTAAGQINAVAFNGLRFALATGAIFIFWLACELVAKLKHTPRTGWNKATILGGLLCGVALFVASNVQQYGVAYTTVGKASFITTLYIVFVPVFGLLMRKKPSIFCRFAIVIAIMGFYLLSVGDSFSLELGDAMMLLCAVFFSIQIIFIDFFVKYADPIKLTLVQFATCAVISVPAMAIFGFPTAEQIGLSLYALLYVGICSAGIGYTLQTIGQRYTEPTTATLLMSLESIVGLIGGILILHEQPSVRELGGCLLVFIAVFLAQTDIKRRSLMDGWRGKIAKPLWPGSIIED